MRLSLSKRAFAPALLSLLLSLPASAADIKVMINTHAHIDHSGLLPRLCAEGFKGPIYCTKATEALLKILLLDSAHIQESDFARAERKQQLGKWHGELPTVLYTVKQANECLSQLQSYDYGQIFEPTQGIEIHYRNAGHIIGSGIAIIDITNEGIKKRLVASGDIGMYNKPLMPDPDSIESADILLVESTYGDRLHKGLQETEDELVEVISTTMKHGGNVVLPAFAVGRTQEILLILIELVRKKRLPHINIWVDSPMATAATHLTERYFDELDEHAQGAFSWFKKNSDALTLRFVADVEESKALNKIKGGAIIISASGMCDAGRIVHHLANNLPRAQNAIIITGFQSYGSLGRRLVDKAQKVRLFGEEVPVRASVHTIGGLSAHADQAGLLDWLKGFQKPPTVVFVVHGEPESSSVLAQSIREELHWSNVIIPERLHTYQC